MRNPKNELHFAWNQPELFKREDEAERVNEELLTYEGSDVDEVI